ncbi:hypothetical protein BDV23DRAFT_196302 [Aspergillus alliaceus]|uniref:CFEM domain-containing protein n=1 Tax=Petromyces alliaceus TaxID=209559 RepID=A0A5N7BYN3_PETAA|nr:hypothetical protein BDV23DRAFT_196302 [Aspergillus alliaceus]
MSIDVHRSLSTTVLSSVPLLAIRAFGQALPATEAPRFNTIPDCAQDCVQSFIWTDYPNNACSSVTDFNCLCKTNTKNGISLCSVDVALKSNVYGICDSIPGALPRTHATITATVVSVLSPTSTPTTSAESPGPSSITPINPTPTRTTDTWTTLTSFQSPVSVTNTARSISSTASSEQTSHNATSGAAAGQESSLNAGAVIGVSVSSGIAGFFILGVVIFFCCRNMKRKYQHPKEQNFFEIGGVMSEPPEFSIPPRRPTLGLNASPRAGDGDTETSRLMSPYQASPRNPAVTVTRPNDDYNYGSTSIHSPDNIGFAISSNSDLEPSVSQSSPRTVSDLLPEKPVYALCPEPLRWSQQKHTRSNSGDTLFEEDVTRPRSFLGSNKQHPNYSNLPTPYNENRKYKRPPRIGLPDNPRAMFHGFRARNNTVVPSGPDRRKQPVYASASEGVQAPHRADIYGNPSPTPPPPPHKAQHDEYIGDYWRGPGIGKGKARDLPEPPLSRDAVRHSYHEADAKGSLLDSSGDEFETININESSGSHRTSRHSGNFRPLTPVREVRTPNNEGQKRDYFNESAPVQYPRMPFSRAVSPAQEIVSRPRIVRRDDIKRVQIRRGKPQPKEVSSDRSSMEIPGRTAKKKRFSSERNLTPSRRGSDLILHVD